MMAQTCTSWYPLQEYAKLRAAEVPELADLVTAARAREAAAAEGAGAGTGAAGASGGSGRAAKKRRVYEDHRPMSEITAGIKAGRIHQVGTRWSCEAGGFP